MSCSPAEAEIPAGEEQVVAVTFAPDHMRRDQFVASFLVDIPNQETEDIVTVRARCWDRQVRPAARRLGVQCAGAAEEAWCPGGLCCCAGD